MVLPQSVVHAQDALLESLFQQLGSRSDYRADYVETKYLNLFDIKLKQRGQLDFEPPQTMMRHQLSPKVQTFTITPQQITIESEGERKEVAIDTIPAMQAFVVSMLAVLSGDASRLERYYDVAVNGVIDQWQLALTPRQKQLRKFIVSIHFSGSKGVVKRIRINEIDGDWSEMELTQPQLHDAG